MHLNIFVSQECFTYCKGCYSYSREEKNGIMLPTDIIIKFLKYAHYKDIDSVTFCGGDPLTRKDIVPLIKKVKEIGFRITMDTLGTLFVKDFELNKNIKLSKIQDVDFIKSIDMIGIPIDGIDSKTISLFRCTNENIFKQQMEIYEKLRNLRANICFNTVVHKENVCQSKEFAKELINKLEFQKWQFFQYSTSGKYAYKNKNLFEITDKDFYLFAKNILDATKKSNIEFKDNKQRNGKYLLIDNSGYAWVQFFENEKENRNIIGNIKNLKDWGKIINTIIESENLNETHRYKKLINR